MNDFEDTCRVAATRACRMWLQKDFRTMEDVINGHMFVYTICELTFTIEYISEV